VEGSEEGSYLRLIDICITQRVIKKRWRVSDLLAEEGHAHVVEEVHEPALGPRVVPVPVVPENLRYRVGFRLQELGLMFWGRGLAVPRRARIYGS